MPPRRPGEINIIHRAKITTHGARWHSSTSSRRFLEGRRHFITMRLFIQHLLPNEIKIAAKIFSPTMPAAGMKPMSRPTIKMHLKFFDGIRSQSYSYYLWPRNALSLPWANQRPLSILRKHINRQRNGARRDRWQNAIRMISSLLIRERCLI